jgi:hypothetical protein
MVMRRGWGNRTERLGAESDRPDQISDPCYPRVPRQAAGVGSEAGASVRCVGWRDGRAVFEVELRWWYTLVALRRIRGWVIHMYLYIQYNI